MENNVLIHHGIKGMKWGVRRFQKKDGSLTPAGKKRYSDGEKTESSSNKTSSNTTSSNQTSSSGSKKKISELTDEELTARINRLGLEKRYKELMIEVNPPKSNAGQSYVVGILKKIGENTAVNLGTQAANHVIGDLINNLAGIDSSDAARRIVNPQKGQSDKK